MIFRLFLFVLEVPKIKIPTPEWNTHNIETFNTLKLITNRKIWFNGQPMPSSNKWYSTEWTWMETERGKCDPIAEHSRVVAKSNANPHSHWSRMPNRLMWIWVIVLTNIAVDRPYACVKIVYLHPMSSDCKLRIEKLIKLLSWIDWSE